MAAAFISGFYGQDSWRATPNLTLNFGLRYDVSSPWWEKYNEIQTLIPGEQSVVFPGSPTGWVFPGDPGVPRTLAPTRWNNFGPRFGLAYAMGDHERAAGQAFWQSRRVQHSRGLYAGSTPRLRRRDRLQRNWRRSFRQLHRTERANLCRSLHQPGERQFGHQLVSCGAAPASTFRRRIPPPALPTIRWRSSSPPSGPLAVRPRSTTRTNCRTRQNYDLSLERQITGRTCSPSATSARRATGCSLRSRRIPATRRLPEREPPLKLRPRLVRLADPAEKTISTPRAGTTSCTTGRRFSGCRQDPRPWGTRIIPFGNDSYFITDGWSTYNSAQINYRHTSGRSAAADRAIPTARPWTIPPAMANRSILSTHALSRGLVRLSIQHQ